MKKTDFGRLAGAISFLIVIIITMGCATPQPESKEWTQATADIHVQEWAITNGMAWPADATSPEFVMTPGMSLRATTEAGEIIILAGDQFERFYTWDGETRSANLWPRKQRWYGSFGLYYPGPGEHWKSNHGVTRGVLGEGILWFKTVKDAQVWIRTRRANGAACVYTDSGLMVTFMRVPLRKQINVEVWQLMIGGQKPSQIFGSNNNAVTVSPTISSGQKDE